VCGAEPCPPEPLPCGLSETGKALGHDDFRAAGLRLDHVKFVHERAHQKNSASEVLRRFSSARGSGTSLRIKPAAFVGDVNDHLFRSEVHGEVNFLFGLFLVAVMESVDDAFADAHPDAVALVFAKAGGFGEAEAHFFSQVDAFDLGFESDFEMAWFLAPSGSQRAKMPDFCGDVWVTQRERLRQWGGKVVISRQLAVVSWRKGEALTQRSNNEVMKPRWSERSGLRSGCSLGTPPVACSRPSHQLTETFT